MTFVEEEGPVGPAILRTAELYECDWIVMGSYSRRGISDIVADSTLDVALRSSWWPIWSADRMQRCFPVTAGCATIQPCLFFHPLTKKPPTSTRCSAASPSATT